MNQDILRRLPSIDELMCSPEVARLAEEHDRSVVVISARAVIQSLREDIAKNGNTPGEDDLTVEAIGRKVRLHLEKKFSPSLRSAINATGVIMHTGLGRAMLPESAVEAVQDVIRGYCNLAADIETGQRSSRDVHLNDLICELTGAEAATITNNNAAATMLILNTLAKGKEVIVSRGQLVEIGGSFRLPEVMEMSGATLREVGTTNKTHLRDYTAAINENTGAILKVHQSNYKIVGFTQEPSIRELAELAHAHNLPVVDDIGSGAIVDLRDFGISYEPMAQESVRAGADVVCFSGDKLIGGPQAGVIVGKAEAIRIIKKNPLARALRVGKMEIAAMEATLRLFLDRNKLTSTHPTYRMLSLSPDEVGKRAMAATEMLRDAIGKAQFDVIDGTSQVGSGTSPAEMIQTRLLSVNPKSMSAAALARRLRHWNPPIYTRISNESVVFDFRTVQQGEEKAVVESLLHLLTKGDTDDDRS